jgi:hypothetical protein
MRQNGVGRDRFAVEVCRDEPSQRVKVEKPHGVCSSDLVEGRRGVNDFCGV